MVLAEAVPTMAALEWQRPVGTRFYDKDDELFVPTGNTLCRIKHIDTAVSDRLLDGISITAMCDVKNMLYGRNGAAYVFAPQKGADAEMVRELDYNLRCFAETVKTSLNIDISTIKCGGAAGGMGAGTLVFLHATLKSGIDVILDVLDFETILPEYNAVFTGEGQFDIQSLNGKVVIGISRRAAKFKVPVITIAGSVRECRCRYRQTWHLSSLSGCFIGVWQLRGAEQKLP